MRRIHLVCGLTMAAIGAGCGAKSPPPAPPAAPTSPPAVELPPPPVPVTSPPPVTGPTPPYPYATPAPPEVGAREVAGTVLTRGEPASGIPLTVINNRTGRTYRLTTDASGIYRVKDVPDGQYYAHFYNDSDNNRVGFWRTRTVQVTASHGGVFPAWDVYLVGMRNSPGQGQSVSFPFTARFEPYPLAITYRFRIHDRGGPGGQALFISELIPAKGLRTFTFDGASNQGSQGAQSVAALGSGRYLWGYQWDSGMAGEGGCLFQDFSAGR